MVGNKKALIISEVAGVTIKIGSTTTEIPCLVVRSSPYQLIVGRPSMKLMSASNQLDKHIAGFRQDSGVTRIPLITEGTAGSDTISDEYTSDESDTSDSEASDDNSSFRETLMIMVNDEKT